MKTKVKPGDLVLVYGWVRTPATPDNEYTEYYFAEGLKGTVLSIEGGVIGLSTTRAEGLALVHENQCRKIR